MKLDIKYASFFNRNNISFVDKDTIEKCIKVIGKNSGIYAIINNVNGYRYIGQSVNIANRLWQHKSLLKNNRHTYKNGDLSLLQKAWNKYGEKSFEFKIIEFCKTDKLDDRERYWIEFYKCNHSKYRQGYNATDGGKGAYSNQNVKGRIIINNGQVQKTIYPNELQMYEQQGFVKGILSQTLDKINKNRKPKSGKEHWAYGKTISDEHKKILSESNKGRTSWIKGKHWDDKHKEMFRILATGRKQSKETREKVLKAKRKPVIQYSKKCEKIAEYISAVEAEKFTSIGRSHISQCCNGKRNTAGGYIWRFKNE